eukprot:SAG31_NODE_4073_length_3614_cov_3.849218_2_plen_74_part_00
MHNLGNTLIDSAFVDATIILRGVFHHCVNAQVLKLIDSHPNIVKLHEIYDTPKKVCIDAYPHVLCEPAYPLRS